MRTTITLIGMPFVRGGVGVYMNQTRWTCSNSRGIVLGTASYPLLLGMVDELVWAVGTGDVESYKASSMHSQVDMIQCMG